MATSFTGVAGAVTATVSITGKWDYGITGSAVTQDVLSENFKQPVAFGTGNNQCDLVVHSSASIGDAGNVELDLENIVAPDGTTSDFSKIKMIYVRAGGSVGDAGGLILGAATANQFSAFLGDATDTILIPSGEAFLLTNMGDGWTVDATNSDLRIEHDGGGTAAIIYYAAFLGLSK